MKSNSKKIGKKFEQDIEKSFPSMLCYERLKDSPNRYRKVHNPADYILFTGKLLLYLECKTVNSKRFPLKNITIQQYAKMLEKSVLVNTFGGYLIELRPIEECYFIPVSEMSKWLSLNLYSEKSIPYEWIKEHGYKLGRQKKRTRYIYDIQALINYLEEAIIC